MAKSSKSGSDAGVFLAEDVAEQGFEAPSSMLQGGGVQGEFNICCCCTQQISVDRLVLGVFRSCFWRQQGLRGSGGGEPRAILDVWQGSIAPAHETGSQSELSLNWLRCASTRGVHVPPPPPAPCLVWSYGPPLVPSPLVAFASVSLLVPPSSTVSLVTCIFLPLSPSSLFPRFPSCSPVSDRNDYFFFPASFSMGFLSSFAVRCLPGCVGAGQIPPNNYAGLAWCSCFFCCWPIGLYAIITSNSVYSKWQSGDYQGAKEASETTRQASIASICIGTILFLLYMLTARSAASGSHP
ncbi:unnamed protein product [Ectocarpus sp. 12 AP-2014]